jgi:hypothetical protein
MSQVKIIGKLMHSYGVAQGYPWANATVDIQFHGYSQTATEQRPSDRTQIKTNPDGTWNTFQFKNADGDYESFYTFKFPNSQPIKIILPASTPPEIEFSQLAIASTPPESPDYPSLIALINTQLGSSGLAFPAGGSVGQSLAVVQDSPSRVLGWVDSRTIFSQSVAATTWTFNHTLNRVPSIEVTDLVGNRLLVETQVTQTQAIVRSESPITGFVYLS